MSSIVHYPGNQKVYDKQNHYHPQRPEPYSGYIIRDNNAMPPPPPPPSSAQYTSGPSYGKNYHPYEQAPATNQRKRRRPPHSYASLISQAILTSKEQKLTLREIYEWVQTRYPELYEANETGWQNTIRHNLSLNKCFRKLPRAAAGLNNKGKYLKGSYWSVDLEQLNNTSFGKQILETGFLCSSEYWHKQQIEERKFQQAQAHIQAQQAQMQTQHVPAQHVPPQHGQNQQAQIHAQQAHAQHAPILHPQPQHPQGFNRSHGMGFTPPYERYTTEVDNHTMANYLANMGNKRHSFSSVSSKTSSIRDSASPRSVATSDFANTPPLQSQPQPKMEMDPLFNPSLMRVNNILN